MTWRQYTLARQLLAEEMIGAPHRAVQAAEDAEHQESLDRLRKDADATS